MRFINSFLSVCLFFTFLISCNSDKKENASETKDATGTVAKVTAAQKKTIVFFGNSLTAGYGLDDPSLAFSGLIQKKIDSLGLAYKVVNAGVSGETTSGGNSRIDWLLKQPLDIFVLELGGNDGLRGIPVSETKKNLQAILDKVKAKYPDAQLVLAGMQIPPNMGKQYANEFKAVYKELADKNNIKLIPFLLEGVGGESKLNQADGIHPTAEGHRILADNVWKIIEELL
ncbi:arylesterase [Dyadobacter psychrotolerans]|uniref:Arylesterase n=1 Tax=Dyadobacter psychrotolerans TaxID=2541721 RepID=A0A4R5DKL4_9BACT|nr:arylesterase [Dyadobacter psychrotolerans]TDE14589.1 arylesterase [Dyadobacter psychrotolerans]